MHKLIGVTVNTEYNLNMLKMLKKSLPLQFVTLFFISCSVWWFTIYFRGLTDSNENNFYTLAYCFISLFGGIIGCKAAYDWGGFKSSFGKTLYLFSLGLLLQFFGQVAYSFYIYILKVEVPYPSFGDIGYFGSVLIYIAALISLAKVLAVRLNFSSIHGKLQVVLIPLALLVISYFIFLDGYIFDWNHPVKVFLDFGYSFGQAFYLSLALIILLLSRNTLGGIMRKPLLFLIFALTVQYVSDFMFLYQAKNETWYVGGPNDFLYSISYFLMTLALTSIGQKLTDLRS